MTFGAGHCIRPPQASPDPEGLPGGISGGWDPGGDGATNAPWGVERLHVRFSVVFFWEDI